jgi:membrane protein YqaA with SNARE-associated domain
MEFLAEYGYLGLFTASFLAATILPFSSEVVLTGLLLHGFQPVMLLTVATTGNVLGSLANYGIGFLGSIFLIQRVLRISTEDFARAKNRFHKYGVFSLLFAWVPIIGDPLTVVAGALKINLVIFMLLVTAGKLIRYIMVYLAVS